MHPMQDNANEATKLGPTQNQHVKIWPKHSPFQVFKLEVLNTEPLKRFGYVGQS